MVSVARPWWTHPLSFRTLVVVVVSWGIVRLLAVSFAAPAATPFAPDEAGYAELVAAVASGEDWVNHSYGFGAAIWPQARALLAPAALLASLGVPAFTSVRLMSVAYSAGSALLMVGLLWLAMRRGGRPSMAAGPSIVSWQTLGLGIFLFLPSHALWGSLGLRESATEFWVLAAVGSTAALFTVCQTWCHKAVAGIGIAMSLTLAYQSRGYMAIALTLALALGVVWFGRSGPRVSLVLAAAVVAGTLLGLTASLPGTEESRSVSGSITGGLERAPEALNPDTYLERGSYQREVSAEYANSAIATDSCMGVPDPRSLRMCEITRLPGAAFAVMFRPLWPLDTPSQWSSIALAASLENFAWLAIVAAALWLLASRRFSLPRVLWVSLAYGGLLVAGMAALEGNFGTAFRHKSAVLWVLCLILILAADRRRSKTQIPESALEATSSESVEASRHD